MVRNLIPESIYSKLPNTLIELTKGFKGRERDIVLLSSLGVLSTCLPNIKGVYDNDDIYCQLYILLIAPPASGKGTMNYSRVLIEKIHDRIVADSKSDKTSNVKVKILPANTSTSEMYALLGSSNHGLLMIESEADTLSNMLKNDWSNYSDILRKIFHHEAISITRKSEGLYMDIREPKLALVLSGTPDQIQPLIKSKNNGLFSRFITYSFDEITDFKNVFEKRKFDARVIFKSIADQVYLMYSDLTQLDKQIEFEFTDEQQETFVDKLKAIFDDVVKNYNQAFIPNVLRHGLIFFKIAMILSALRNKEKITSIDKLPCNEEDFDIIVEIMPILLRHCQYVFDNMDTSLLSSQDEDIIDKLKTNFTRKQILDIAKSLKIPIRTIDDKLRQWQEKNLVKRVKKGHYKKL